MFDTLYVIFTDFNLIFYAPFDSMFFRTVFASGCTVVVSRVVFVCWYVNG